MSTAPANRVTIVGGEGAWIETDQGVRLLDATAGLWHANIGHGRESLALAAAPRCASSRPTTRSERSSTTRRSRWPTASPRLSPIEDAKVFFVSRRLGCDRHRGQAGAAVLAAAGPDQQADHHQPRMGLPRAARVRHLDRRDPLQPRGLRLGVADPRDRSRARERRRRARGRDHPAGPRPGRGRVRRADHRHRRRDPAGPRLPAARRADLRGVRRPVRRRRGDHRLRAHRRDVRHRPVRPAPRHGRDGEGDHVRVRAAGRRPDRAPGVGAVLRRGRADLPPRRHLFRPRDRLRGRPGQPRRA